MRPFLLIGAEGEASGDDGGEYERGAGKKRRGMEEESFSRTGGSGGMEMVGEEWTRDCKRRTTRVWARAKAT